MWTVAGGNPTTARFTDAPSYCDYELNPTRGTATTSFFIVIFISQLRIVHELHEAHRGDARGVRAWRLRRRVSADLNDGVVENRPEGP